MKVCILGSGLSALTLAKALVNQNICVDMLIKKKTKNTYLSRTLGISKSNVKFFNHNIENIDNIIWKIKKIDIFTDNLKNEKLLNFEDKNYEIFSIVKNSNLSKILEKSLNRSKYFSKINLTKKINFLKKYSLIINTDYSNKITKKYFSKKFIKKYNSFAYTTIIEHERCKNDVATQIFTKQGPIAFLPISNKETSIVYSINNPKYQSEETIRNLISIYNYSYKIKKINKVHFFELNSLDLRSYYEGNVLAFGDLLHRIHPLAGQGFNMTIRDIKILLSIIKEKQSLGLSIDSSINSEFQKKSKHRNFIFSNGIDLIHQFFNIERKLKNNFISKSVQFLGKNTSVNKMFTKIADKGLLF
jgi:2-octaprenyl-6-methoxyphenol hydroxylase